MINITVHHHHQPHFACLAACHLQAAAGGQHNHQQASSSQVEVHYSGPQINHEKHLSGNCSAAAQRMNAKTELNYAHGNENENVDLQRANKRQQQYSKTDQDIDTSKPNNGRHNNLHARSISLIVNPEFSSDSESELALSRRRTLPRLVRRTRLLLATGNAQNTTTTTNNNSSHQMTATIGREQQQQPEQVSSGPPTASEAAAVVAEKQGAASIETDAALRQAESCARLRETGAFLRQISDEFSKARRRTI